MRTGYGYIYVIAFSNGEVKVGRASRVQTRIGQHKNAASKRGLTVTGHWASGPHVEWDINEGTLKRSALKLGGTPVGTSREYFTGLRWVDVVGVAGRLPYTSPSEVPPCHEADRCAGNISEAEKDARTNALGVQVREVGTDAEKETWQRTRHTLLRSKNRQAEAAA